MSNLSSARGSFRDSMSRFRITGAIQGSDAGYLDYLESVFKDRAKALRRGLEAQGMDLKLSEVQEALAKTVGFPNLHGMQQLLGRIREQVAGLEFRQLCDFVESHPNDIDALMPLECLCHELRGVVPLDADDVAAAGEQADRLAVHLATDAQRVRDSVAIAWADEPKWDRLRTRTPLDKPLTEPIYTFIVDQDNDGRAEGRFELSAAGQWIWENVLGTDETDDSQARAEYEKAMGVAGRYPGFFIAWSAAASALAADADEDEQDAYALQRQLVERALKEAEAVIPKGFKGTIPWGHLDNRPYLRLLWQQLQLDVQGKYTIRTGKARRVAQKILRLNPNDNQGVRFIMPLLNALSGASDAVVARSCKQAMKEPSPAGQLNVGLAELWERRSGGLQQVLEAVFRVPEFGSILLGEPDVRPYERFRMPEGYEDPVEECTLAFRAMNADETWADWLQAILRDKDLLQEEKRLRGVLGSRDARNEGSWEKWYSEVPAAAKRMAAALLQRYPIPAGAR